MTLTIAGESVIYQYQEHLKKTSGDHDIKLELLTTTNRSRHEARRNLEKNSYGKVPQNAW